MAKEQKNPEVEKLQMENLQLQIEKLQSKVEQSKTSEELYAERVAKYEANQKFRDELKQQIQSNIQTLQGQYPSAPYTEIVQIEAMQRRIKDTKSKGQQCQALEFGLKQKIKNLKENSKNQ